MLSTLTALTGPLTNDLHAYMASDFHQNLRDKLAIARFLSPERVQWLIDRQKADRVRRRLLHGEGKDDRDQDRIRLSMNCSYGRHSLAITLTGLSACLDFLRAFTHDTVIQANPPFSYERFHDDFYRATIHISFFDPESADAGVMLHLGWNRQRICPKERFKITQRVNARNYRVAKLTWLPANLDFPEVEFSRREGQTWIEAAREEVWRRVRNGRNPSVRRPDNDSPLPDHIIVPGVTHTEEAVAAMNLEEPEEKI